MVAAVKGYKLILVMPESMSVERRRLMATYGAKFELTPREGGMPAAIERAKALAERLPRAWIPSQFDNPANIQIHRETTAREILSDFPDGFAALITGVGTGGHFTGCAELLKKKFPQMKAYAVEPALSPVIGGGQPGPHPLQGIGAGFIPDQPAHRPSRRRDPGRAGTRRSTTPAAAPARRGSSSASPPARRSPPWRRSSRSCRRGAGCSPSATTPASATSRSRACSTDRRVAIAIRA